MAYDERIGTIINDYTGVYELRCPDYTPTEGERQMLEDFGCGLITELEDRGFKIVATDLIAKAESSLMTDRELIEAIQGALNTEETGAALIEVARNACRAEQEIAAMKIRLSLETEARLNNPHAYE